MYLATCANAFAARSRSFDKTQGHRSAVPSTPQILTCRLMSKFAGCDLQAGVLSTRFPTKSLGFGCSG